MPKYNNDNYQYNSGTINTVLERFSIYDHGDGKSLQIVDTKTNRAVNIIDGNIEADSINGVYWVSEKDGIDIFDSANKILSDAGPDSTIYVKPGRYEVSTQLELTEEGQIINFLGSDIRLQDDANINPVKVSADNISIKDLVIDGNRSNNTFLYALFAKSVNDMTLENVEIENSPVGIHISQSSNSYLTNISSSNKAANSDNIIEIEDSSNIIFSDSNLTGFSTYGVNVVNSEDIVLNGITITTNPVGQPIADAALHIDGTIQSLFEVTIESDGDINDGILSEAYDPGGVNEVLPNANNYDVKVEGVNDIGIHIIDGETDIIEATILGSYSNGETNQAFLVETGPANADAVGHQLNIDAKNCDRVTDTQIASNNAGMIINGHFEKIKSVSTVQFNGTSIFQPTFGPAMNKPAFNILVDTGVNARLVSKKKTTDNSGQVNLDWSDRFRFAEKPIINVQLESPGSWYITNYNVDTNGYYTDLDIQFIDPSGTPFGSNESVRVGLEGV